MNKVKILLFIIAILLSVSFTTNSLYIDYNSEFNFSFVSKENSSIQNIVAPSFINNSGVAISGSLDIGSVINVGLTPISINSELYLYFERDGAIIESTKIEYKIKKESASKIYTHNLSEPMPLTIEGFREIIFYDLWKLKLGDRIKIVIKDGPNSIESGWYNVERNLIFKNFRFTWQIDVIDKYESNSVLKSRDNREFLYSDYDYRFLKESPRILEVYDKFTSLYLVGEVDNEQSIKNESQKYSFEQPRIFNNDSPKSLPIEFFLKRGDKIISKTVVRKISLSKNWPGERSIYYGDIDLSNLFSIDIKHGDQIVARSTQFFSNGPNETSVRINDGSGNSDCEKDLIGEGSKTYSFEFFKNIKENENLSGFLYSNRIRVNQEFYFEIAIESDGKVMCDEGIVELIEHNVEKNTFTRNRILVEKIKGDNEGHITNYRSSKIKLSYSEGENQIKVGIAKDKPSNEIWIISSENEFEYLKTVGEVNADTSLVPVYTEPPLEDGEGFLKILIKKNYNYTYIPKGKVIITGVNNYINEKEGISWYGNLPVGVYKAEYDFMGGRFGVKDIYVKNDVDQYVYIESENQFGWASIEPRLIKDMYAIKETQSIYEDVLHNSVFEFSRNGESLEDNYGSALLLQGNYKISLNKSKNLLFPVTDIDIEVFPNQKNKWPSPVGILGLKKNKEKDGSVIRSAAIVRGIDSESPLFAFSEDTGKLLPIGVYTIELQKANSIKKVTKEFEIKASEITIIEADFDTDSKGQVHMIALDKDGKKIGYFVRIKQADKYLKSVEGIGLTEDLPTGKYDLIFSIVGQDDVERNIEVIEGAITEVVIDFSEENEKNTIDLNGNWKYHSAIIHFSQNGSSIEGEYILPKLDGDYSIQGTFDGKTLIGVWHLSVLGEIRQKCSDKVPAKLELTLSSDGNRLEGRLEDLRISDNCEVLSQGWGTGGVILTRIISLESNFNSNPESWDVVGDAYLGKEGRPDLPIDDGAIVATDRAGGLVWYWKAPYKYHGDHEDLYGTHLSFKLKTKFRKDIQFDDDDIVLRGGGMTLIFDTDVNPGIDWTNYRVKFHESAGWINKETGRRVIESEFREVLRNIESLMIRGEYHEGIDTGWLDSVRFE